MRSLLNIKNIIKIFSKHFPNNLLNQLELTYFHQKISKFNMNRMQSKSIEKKISSNSCGLHYEGTENV